MRDNHARPAPLCAPCGRGRSWKWWILALLITYTTVILHFLPPSLLTPGPALSPGQAHKSKEEIRSTSTEMGLDRRLARGLDRGWVTPHQDNGLQQWRVRQVAWIMPFLWGEGSTHQELPYFAPLWAKTVAASAPFLQVFIFYEDPAMQRPFR
jgi:hypothetical protein